MQYNNRHATLKSVSFVNTPSYYIVCSTVVQKRPPKLVLLESWSKTQVSMTHLIYFRKGTLLQIALSQRFVESVGR